MERQHIPPRPARLAIGALLAVHGLIHLIGVVVPWGIATVETFPYRTAILGDMLELGDAGARVLGLAWLVVCIGFVAAAAGIVAGKAWWLPLACGLSIVSILLCVAGLPEAVTGIPVNVAILAICGLVVVRRPSAEPAGA